VEPKDKPRLLPLGTFWLFEKLPLNKPPTACSQTPVWEHHCRETEFLVHYALKQEFGSEQLKDILKN
jgi:hypothetical protein